MISSVAVAKRYAEGFLEFAKGSIGFEKGLEELKKLKDLFRDNADFKNFLESPEISFAEKCTEIDIILSENFSEETRFFLQLLIKKNRFDAVSEIAEYARLKYAHGDEVDALVVASYPLDTDELESIKGALEKKFSKKMHIYMDLDPSLMGGVRATVGNMVIDGSVKKRLEEMKNKLLTIKAG